MRATRMSRRGDVWRVVTIGAALLLAAPGAVGGVAAAQLGQPAPTPVTRPGALPGLDEPAEPATADPGVRARMEEERVKAVNDDRHKRLAEDVDRLVELTGELKTEVDKTSKDELSIDVIKKAQEIEKLAHDVQSRMKN